MVYEYAAAAKPRLTAPAGAVDTHMHLYEPGYPKAPTAITPPLPNGGVADYRAVQKRLGVKRVVVVQPSTYGLDNRCTMDCVAKIGPDARAVIGADPSFKDDELKALKDKGARGLRFFMLTGACVTWDMLDEMASRGRALGMHIQLQLDGRTLPEHITQLRPMAAQLVIDHVGRFMEPVTTDHVGFKALLSLVDSGAWVKLSAPYESSKAGAPWTDIGLLAKELVERAPDRMVWATNWPHPNQSPRPDDAVLLDMLLDWVEDDRVRNKILADNPARLYGF